MGPEQSVITRHCFAVDKGLRNMAALGQFGFDPFRIYIAAEAGDKLMFLASSKVEITFGIKLPKIPAWPPLFNVRCLT